MRLENEVLESLKLKSQYSKFNKIVQQEVITKKKLRVHGESYNEKDFSVILETFELSKTKVSYCPIHCNIFEKEFVKVFEL